MNTDWDPTFTTTVFSVATIRVDGAFPNVACAPGAWQAGDIAGNCVSATWTGTFYDIFDSDIGIDPTPGDFGEGWEFAQVVPAANKYSFRGVMTHEVGHGIKLRDSYATLDCDATPLTMCGGVQPGAMTWEQRTLQTDDINAADAVY